MVSRVAFSKTPGPRHGVEEAPSGGPGGNRAPACQRAPRTKARPQERKPQKATRKGLPPRGGEEHGRGFAPLGLGYCLCRRSRGGPGGNRAPAGQRIPRTKARPQKRKLQKAIRKGLPPKGGGSPAEGFGPWAWGIVFRTEDQRTLAAWPSVVWGAWQPPSERAL